MPAPDVPPETVGAAEIAELAADARSLSNQIPKLRTSIDNLEKAQREETAARRAKVRTLYVLVGAVAVLALVVGAASVTVTRRFQSTLKQSVCESYLIDIPKPGGPTPTSATGIQKWNDAVARYQERDCGALPSGPAPAPQTDATPQPAPTPSR
jgi:hypothetical protein